MTTVQPQVIPVQRLCMEPQAKRNEPLFGPHQTQPPVKGLEPRLKWSLEVALITKPYDIVRDLEELKPNISMKQLLVIAPKCRATLNSTVIWK